MKLFISVLTIISLICLPQADLYGYYYNHPQIPFNAGIPAQPQRRLYQPQAQPHVGAQYKGPTTIVHHYGLAGTANVNKPLLNGYSSAPAAHPHHATSGRSISSYNTANTFGFNNNYASNIATSYSSHQQYSQQQHQHHHHHPQQQQYNLNLNPLTTAYQKHQTVYGNPPQTQQSTQNYENRPLQFGASTTNGGIVIGAPTESHTYPFNGNYISQSESGQLHAYQHQQNPATATHPFRRVVTNCLPNGQCEHLTLEQGQPDPQHLQNAALTKAKAVDATVAAANSQAASNNVKGFEGSSHTYPEVQSNSIENIKLVRPPNRRYYEYTEVVLPNDPYN